MREGRLQIGEPHGFSDEVRDRFIVLAVGAALEATTTVLRRSIEQRGDALSDNERELHQAIIRVMDACARDAGFIRDAIRSASEVAEQAAPEAATTSDTR
ncbi:MAG: hypothetical protein ACHQ2Y_00040 [Candidatus Lutacidiplasmatales archaeon]